MGENRLSEGGTENIVTGGAKRVRGIRGCGVGGSTVAFGSPLCTPILGSLGPGSWLVPGSPVGEV